MKRTDTPSWEKAKHLLSGYSGAASELFLIDLPASQWAHIVSLLAKLPDLEVTAFRNEALEEPAGFNSVWERRIQSPGAPDTQYSFCSARGTSEHLQVYIWAGSTTGPMELEFVFWNNLTFPSNLCESELSKRLGWLVDMAENFRNGAPGARCILSSEHNGDPRELLREENVLVW